MGNIPDLLPPAHLDPDSAVDHLLIVFSTSQQKSAFRQALRQAYDLGYQAAVLDTQARAIENGATGGGKRSPAQKRQTAKLNGHGWGPWGPGSSPRQAPGNPWTEDEDAAVLRGEFPETHTRGACYARRSRLRKQVEG